MKIKSFINSLSNRKSQIGESRCEIRFLLRDEINMNDIELLLVFGITILISSGITFFILRYFFATRLKGIEKSSDTISKISEGMVQQSNSFIDLMKNSLNTLQTDVMGQLKELREMSRDLQTTQKDTQSSFEKFVSLVRMRPQTKGEVGEGIVRWVLSSLPANSWKEQVTISGGRVDFIVYLPPDQEKVLIDSKFSFPTELLESDNLVAADQQTINKINRGIIKRSKELEKYLVPENTNIGFLLMYIPDILFSYLSDTTFKELTGKKIIPVNVSGLLSTLLIISRQIQVFRIGEAISRLESIKTTFDSEIDAIQKITKTSKGQLQKALTNVEKIDVQLDSTRRKIFREFGLIEEEST